MRDDLSHYMEATSRQKKRADEAEARASEVAKELREYADRRFGRGSDYEVPLALHAFADRLEDADPKEQTPDVSRKREERA